MMVMTMKWYDNMLLNCLLQSSCLCLCVWLLSFHTLSDLFGCPISCTIFNLIPNIVQYVCSLECSHIHMYIQPIQSVDVTVESMPEIAIESHEFMIYQEEKCNICSAICIIYALSVVSYTLHAFYHRWRQTITHKRTVRMRQPSKSIGTSSDTGINHQYTNHWLKTMICNGLLSNCQPNKMYNALICVFAAHINCI